MNCAAILCDPTERLEVVKVTVGPLIVAVPMMAPSEKKVTVPVLPEPKVAVKTTDCR